RYTINALPALCRAMPQAQFTVYVNPHCAGLFLLPQNARLEKVKTAPHLPWLKTAWQQTVLPARLARDKADAALFFANTAPIRCPTPFVLVMHDLIPFAFPGNFAPLQRAALRTLWVICARQAKVVATPSPFVADCVQKNLGVAAERIRVAPGAADSFALQRGNKPSPAKGGSILYVASEKPHKNLPLLFAAFAEAKKAAKHARLVVTGVLGQAARQIEAQARQIGLAQKDFSLPGRVSQKELLALYDEALFGIFPSLYEGFGLPVLEAMMRGRAVACSKIPPLVQTAGRAALYFDPLDKADMARAMARLFTDSKLRNDFAEKGLRRARRFSWEKTGLALADCLTLALAGDGP
ncbi:MAG: glycosyltransferase family 1 protein, partial [Desulfatibacillaceae bacterium]|nr:glycosyltransferase family 1 protein [Desulfatibacillaceae bacterium]